MTDTRPRVANEKRASQIPLLSHFGEGDRHVQAKLDCRHHRVVVHEARS